MSSTIEQEVSSSSVASTEGSDSVTDSDLVVDNATDENLDGDTEQHDSSTEGAMERALKRIEDDKKDLSDEDGQQALGDEDSTELDSKDVVGKTDELEADAERGDDGDVSDSTVMAPEDWPDDWKERFGSIPEEAQGIVHDMYKDMNVGLNKSLQKLSQIRQQDETLFSTLQENNISSGSVQEVIDFALTVKSDPRKGIAQIAAQEGIEVFFEQPLAEGVIPEFETTAELVEYTRQQTMKDFENKQKAENGARDQADKARDSKAMLEAEFVQARADISNFGEHETAIFDRMAATPNLSVKDAYSLVTLVSLQDMARAGQSAIKELAALKSADEKRRKGSTKPVHGSKGKPTAVKDKNLSATESAMARAQARIAKDKNAA